MISLDELAALLSRMGHGAYAVVFAGAMLESAAMLGLLVPGEALVLLAGFFASQGVFDLDLLIVCVAAGATVGDSLGYEMGRVLGRPALLKYGSRFGVTPRRVDEVERFFARHGASSVFLGRFVGFARALVPFLAGASRMQYRRFLPYNAGGAALWAVAIVLAGYFVGSSWQAVESWLGRAGAVAAAALGLAWLLRRHLRRPPAGWVELAVIVLAVCLFAAIAQDVVAGDPLAQLDLRLVRWFETHRLGWLTGLLGMVSQLHAPVPMTVAALAFAAWLARRHDWLWLKTLLVALPAGMLVNTGLKLAFHRARPELQDPILGLHTFSFPSGHVAGSMLFYGVLCAFVIAHSRRPVVRVGALLAAAAIVLLVAVSRLYLGAHYLSDVLGALAEAGAWLTLTLSVMHGRLVELWRESTLELLGRHDRQVGADVTARGRRLAWAWASVALLAVGLAVAGYEFLGVLKK